jgi:RNA polymerase sigma-70 factor (ECF subfamily)
MKLGTEAALVANGPRLLGFFANRVDRRDEAADLLSEVFVVACRRPSDVPADPDEARMWLFGVARGVLDNHRRGRRRRDALAGRLREEFTESIDDDAARVEVRHAVASLPSDLAELVRLVHWDGFSLEDAARHLGIPASTVRGRHARARELLRARLAVAP